MNRWCLVLNVTSIKIYMNINYAFLIDLNCRKRSSQTKWPFVHVRTYREIMIRSSIFFLFVFNLFFFSFSFLPRVIAVDLRGYGGSSKPMDVSSYELKNMVSDVIGVINGLGKHISYINYFHQFIFKVTQLLRDLCFIQVTRSAYWWVMTGVAHSPGHWLQITLTL